MEISRLLEENYMLDDEFCAHLAVKTEELKRILKWELKREYKESKEILKDQLLKCYHFRNLLMQGVWENDNIKTLIQLYEDMVKNESVSFFIDDDNRSKENISLIIEFDLVLDTGYLEVVVSNPLDPNNATFEFVHDEDENDELLEIVINSENTCDYLKDWLRYNRSYVLQVLSIN